MANASNCFNYTLQSLPVLVHFYSLPLPICSLYFVELHVLRYFPIHSISIMAITFERLWVYFMMKLPQFSISFIKYLKQRNCTSILILQTHVDLNAFVSVTVSLCMCFSRCVGWILPPLLFFAAFKRHSIIVFQTLGTLKYFSLHFVCDSFL